MPITTKEYIKVYCGAFAALILFLTIFSCHLPAAVFNVRDYGAVGNGVVDDRLAIQLAATATRAAGPGNTLYLPTGIYLVSETVHPYNSDYGICFAVPGETTVQGDGMDATIIKRAANGVAWPVNSAVLMSRDGAWSGMNHDIILRDFTVDGNSANNTLVPAQVGILMSGNNQITYDHVRVKNVRGTRNCCGGEGTYVFLTLNEAIAKARELLGS